jgi:uncharacterized phage protein (TIGR02218 family)
MKNLSIEMTDSLLENVATLAHCWKLTRRDGVIMGFTDHTTNIQIEAITYHASSGFTPSAIASNSSLKVDNLTVEGMLDNEHIHEEDILAGAYDYAEIDFFQVDYTNISAGILHLKTGWIGEIRLASGHFHAQLRGLTQHLNAHAGALYSPSCRAQFGDARCSIDLEAYTSTGTITGVVSRSIVIDASRSEETGTFHFGTLTFTSGANINIKSDIRRHDLAGNFLLLLPLPYDANVGDNYVLTRGCDKQFSTCHSTFHNAANFRGEPHVPGTDALLTTAGTLRG